MKRIVKLVAILNNISEATVEVIYRTYWLFIREHFASLEVKNIKSEEEFNLLKTSINLPGLGKFYISWDKIQKHQRRLQYVNNLFKNESTET